MISYTPQGTCSRKITFEIHEGNLTNVSFYNGCPGNLQAISKLVEGMPTDKVVHLLKGIDCNGRGTSCADQLAQAIEKTVKDSK